MEKAGLNLADIVLSQSGRQPAPAKIQPPKVQLENLPAAGLISRFGTFGHEDTLDSYSFDYHTKLRNLGVDVK